MYARDIAEIEQIYNYYEHCLICGDWGNAHRLFSDRPDVSFLVVRTNHPIIGHDNIKANFYQYDKVFPDYGSFHTGAQICTPLIEISADGQRAFGMFPTFGFFVHGRVSGHTEPPYPVDSTFDLWYDEFIREDGRWKILHFNFISMVAAPIWEWNPSNEAGWAAKGLIRSLPPAPSPYIDEAGREDICL